MRDNNDICKQEQSSEKAFDRKRPAKIGEHSEINNHEKKDDRFFLKKTSACE